VTVAAVAGVSAGVAVAATPGADGQRAAGAGSAVARASAAAALTGQAPPRHVARHKDPGGQRPGPRSGSGHGAAPSQLGHQKAAATRRPARPVPTQARHDRPYLIFDSVTPAAIPAGHEIATYIDGPFPVSPAEVAGRGPVLWIDINGTDPSASVLDVEPGCATVSAAPGWVTRRLTAAPDALAIIYTMRSEWPAAQAAVAILPARMRSRIRWWIADPTGYPHVLPGSQATQWYWGSSYDISTATPAF
jgi:hypothetical protein